MQIQWSEIAELTAGEIVSNPVGESESISESLLIENGSNERLRSQLTTIVAPRLSSHLYALRFPIRYENVAGPGHFEMWNYFPDGGAYFTKTLSDSGPMGVIQGTSDWRDCVLPFRGSPETGLPNRLELGLVLPSEGKVWIGALTLLEYTESEFTSALKVTGAWWTPQQSGLAGGLFGAFLGILGALAGVLVGIAKGRRLCFAVYWFGIAIGVCCLVAGILALFLGQPYEVWYPLLLIGFIGSAVFGGTMPTIRKRFAAEELRRMDAMDARLPGWNNLSEIVCRRTESLSERTRSESDSWPGAPAAVRL